MPGMRLSQHVPGPDSVGLAVRGMRFCGVIWHYFGVENFIAAIENALSIAIVLAMATALALITSRTRSGVDWLAGCERAEQRDARWNWDFGLSARLGRVAASGRADSEVPYQM